MNSHDYDPVIGDVRLTLHQSGALDIQGIIGDAPVVVRMLEVGAHELRRHHREGTIRVPSGDTGLTAR